MTFQKTVGLLVAGMIATLAGVTVVAQSKLDFTLVNKTGLTISELYVSPAHSTEWEEDVLGRDVLKHNESLEITFSRKEKTCAWDMKIVDEDDDEIVWENFDLCKAEEITLMYERGKPTARIK